MVLSNGSKILTNKNINKSFFWFCVKKRPFTLLYLFQNLMYYIISIILNNREYYLTRKFKYYKSVKNMKEQIAEFKKSVQMTNYFNIKPDFVIEKLPNILLKETFDGYKTIGYSFDKNFNVEIDKFNDDIKKIDNNDTLYLNCKKNNISVNCKYKIIIHNKHARCISNRENKWITRIINVGTLFILSNIITIMSFFFVTSNLDIEFFKSLFEINVYIMNFIPIFSAMLFIYFLTGKVYVAFSLIYMVVLIFGITNQTKLAYRDDIVKFEDLFIIKEALIMSRRYAIIIKKYTVAFLVAFIPLTLFLRYYLTSLKKKWYIRIAYTIILTIILLVGYNKFYIDEETYDKLGDISLINIWISTRQYQIRGMIYPFIYTIKEYSKILPNNYDENVAIEVLNKYKYENIPQDKKVNVVAIMFEAFNDFSKFKEIEFKTDIYKKFHLIQNESISGTIVTQIFGGGTIVSERNFLTGYYSFPTFRKSTNSYVWYFKEQGYNTDAMHPAYGAFYNRTSANINLGFDNYYNYDNRYNLVQEGVMWDDHYFINDIVSQYEKNKKTGNPYFNFSVTYQNHGPYVSTKYDNKPYYIKKKNMSDEGYNTINEYFKGIYDTVDAMYQLIEYFKKESEPTIVIMFGDHNPYLGENQLAYNELGINMDISTIEGFRNYYSTPYIIYGNPSVKKIFNKTFVGKGEEISPIFLMNELFDYIGLKGNKYMQYMRDLKKQKTVMGTVYEKENGKYISAEEATSNEEYEIVSYYVANNFKLQK